MSRNLTVSGMILCPKCHGSTWTEVGDCKVCNATGVITTDGEPVSYEDGVKFYDWIEEQKKGRRR